ncbi:MAG: anaerobic ribonucleoside-triphosphate reductase activating protein [Pseudomonadota bacterium]
MTTDIRIAGLTPLTSIDFPGRLAAVVFLQGCPWRCGYCHNPGLQPANAPSVLSWREVEAFLDRRRGLLDGLVFSGGEPTLHRALPDLLGRVQQAGFQTGLHSAGIYPTRLRAVLPMLDWLGLDIKAPWHRYEAVAGVPGSGANAAESLADAMAAGVELECRTTWHPGLFPYDELRSLARTLARAGITRWVLQRCRVGGTTLPGPDPAQLAQLREALPGTTLRG